VTEKVSGKKQFKRQPELTLPKGIEQVMGQIKAPMNQLQSMIKSEEIANMEQEQNDANFKKQLFSMKL